MRKADVIIVGSGVSALQLAKHLSEDTNVIVFTKSKATHGNSSYAQGGISAAIKEDDDPFAHYLDTVEAGRYTNQSQYTLEMTREAPAIINELIAEGCEFDRNPDGHLQLGREGGHHDYRIVHSGGDQTGKRLMKHLIQQLPDTIELYEDHFVYDLVIHENRCYGVKCLTKNGTRTFTAAHVILSTGGCGQLYSLTSNAETITGDGIALAYQAGAEITDMEFIQFHPTLLYKDGRTHGLVTEAVRGEGAVLLNENGDAIMDGVHPLRDLAPRNVVAQTIYQQLQQGHHVYLDIRSISDFSKRFPTVAKLCEAHNIDIQKGQIPVSPGCHFSMGGIATDRFGRTAVNGLYALGEAACTGVHGANRLASNSLLEGLVFGKRLAAFINSTEGLPELPDLPERKPSLHHSIVDLPPVKELQQRMMDLVGMVRTEQQLLQQKEWLDSFRIDEWFTFDLSLLTTKQVTTLFMLQTAWLITCSALERKESRGAHFRSDFPEELKVWQQKQSVHKRNVEKRNIHEPIYL
ncbi:L-aspartate oxidase [Halobacillus locisalis]|uniref:L-aspartate oxidase n=1 Tax=Halobacillus locisalis TaxID=220753 RepID=A0A838CWY6_9BACI|nr:L-aspartate oxidase [Halobacillus locisalis]MBA2176662.1 L-aspartate oxidase [Halobacillus locisalis]